MKHRVTQPVEQGRESPGFPGNPWDFPGKNTGVGCCFLLWGNIPNQGLNLLGSFPAWQVGSLLLSHLGNPVHLAGLQITEG